MTNKATNIAGLLIGVIAAALGFALVHFLFGNPLKFASYDSLFVLRPNVKITEAVIIYMDEDSHTALNQSFTAPWDRNLHATLLERLTAAGARAVVFDIHFSGEGANREATTNLVRAIQKHGSVVLGADVVPTFGGVRGIGAKRYEPPFDLLDEAAAEVGSVEVDAHHDLVVRRHQAHPDDLLPSLSWAAAKAAGALIGELGDRSMERWINYYGPPGSIPHISYHRALTAPAAVFSNKVVFIGARLLTKLAGERKDEYRSPYSLLMKEDFFMPGVEIQATEFLNLVRGDWLRRPNPRTEEALMVLIGLLAGFGLIHVRPWFAAVLALAAAMLLLAVTYLFFWNWNIWFPWLVPVAAQMPVALGLAVAYNSFRLYLDNKLLEQSLSRHLSPARAKQLLQRRELLQPGAEKQLLTIMFTDIAGFTKASEGMDSGELAQLMNNYFEQAISCVHETDGFLVKIIGDALFVIWNAPLEQPDHAARAFRTAALLGERIADFHGPNGLILRTRIGIHTGVADVGNFGSTKRFDYTAIGENINLASRLEGLNKHLGTQVLASGQARGAVAGEFHFRPLGRFRLKGFEKAVEVHELLAQSEHSDHAFSEALQHFARREFDAAEAGFCRVLKLRAADGPARFYLAQLQHLRSNAPPPDWAGEIELSEK